MFRISHYYNWLSSISRLWSWTALAGRLLIAYFVLQSIVAEAENGTPNLHLRLFNYTSEIPEGILSGRSAVFVLVDDENKDRTGWKELSIKAHKVIVGTGTDIVGYYNIYDLFAGHETQRSFAQDMLKREVKNILILEKKQGSFSLKVTKFNEKPTFMDHGQNAWRSENIDLREVMADYKRAVGASGQHRSNFLMADAPEFFEDTGLIRRQRFDIFNQDLKLDKLAVPLFPTAATGMNVEKGNSSNNISDQLLRHQQQWKIDSIELASIMETYPFAYGIVAADSDEKKLREQGYQFMLYYLNTSGKVIHDLLNYKSDKNVTDYITIKPSTDKPNLVTIQAHRPVYKYYIKHIFSGEIYLGNVWDAEESWQAALKNHINGIKNKIKQ
ncbi:hypothetical protein QQ020_27995 [Fulvivirgaceae bacterium BMA12]|uniref:Uncharacterized protein n=1 Tax=Agaribacillus aureus TaxID=3051825 RepID=A0ABT8LDV0_9BACT|nr:hypothetical protein [Fulvivirgaceae bacterium BMA12]